MKRQENYHHRLVRVLNYIYDHLDKDLDINHLAEIACFSPYHFHRLYREIMGETINHTVRRLRLQQAAAILIRTDLPIHRIASAVGYSSTEGFTRAFSKTFSIAPKVYRQRKQHSENLPPIDDSMLFSPLTAGDLTMTDSNQNTSQNISPDNTYTVKLEQFDRQTVIGINHQGDYMGIGNKFEQLFSFASGQQLVNEKSRSFGLYYGDPLSVAEEELRSMACLNVEQDYSIPEAYRDQLTLTAIPAGECASLVFKGPYAELQRAYRWLYGQWLPNSGREVTDFPAFEEYLNDAKTTAPNELLTVIRCLLV